MLPKTGRRQRGKSRGRTLTLSPAFQSQRRIFSKLDFLTHTIAPSLAPNIMSVTTFQMGFQKRWSFLSGWRPAGGQAPKRLKASGQKPGNHASLGNGLEGGKNMPYGPAPEVSLCMVTFLSEGWLSWLKELSLTVWKVETDGTYSVQASLATK